MSTSVTFPFVVLVGNMCWRRRWRWCWRWRWCRDWCSGVWEGAVHSRVQCNNPCGQRCSFLFDHSRLVGLTSELLHDMLTYLPFRWLGPAQTVGAVGAAEQAFAKALVTAAYNPTTHVLNFGTPTMTMLNHCDYGLTKVYVPRFYLDTYEALDASVPNGGGTIVVGSPGTGKTMMRNVHAWLIADSMKHPDDQVMKGVHQAVKERRKVASASATVPTPGPSGRIRILFAKFHDTFDRLGTLVELTRRADGSIHAKATEEEHCDHIRLSSADYVLADFSNGERFTRWPGLWRKAQRWGYSSPGVIQAHELTKQGLNRVLYTPSEWPVEELVRAAAALELGITYHIDVDNIGTCGHGVEEAPDEHATACEEGVAESKEDGGEKLTEQEIAIRHRAALYGGVPRVCLATDPNIVNNYHKHFIVSCGQVTTLDTLSHLFAVWKYGGAWEGSHSLVSIVTLWPRKRWYSLTRGQFESKRKEAVLVCRSCGSFVLYGKVIRRDGCGVCDS